MAIGSHQKYSASDSLPIIQKQFYLEENDVIRSSAIKLSQLSPTGPVTACFPIIHSTVWKQGSDCFTSYLERPRIRTLDIVASATDDASSIRETASNGSIAPLAELAWRMLYSRRGAFALECAIRKKRVPKALLDTSLRWNPYTMGPHSSEWLK